MEYCENHSLTIERLKGKIDVVIITATKLETDILHTKLKPIQGYSQIIKIICEKTAYYIGIFEDYTICHSQCVNMGSTQAGSSSVTTFQAISHWNPKVLIMIGIAFGVDKENQKIGDVLIAETINGYNYVKVANSKETHRGKTIPSTDNLTRRINEIAKNWNYLVGEEKMKSICGEVLSGDTLINDIEYRNKLTTLHEKAIGGEMEGIGFYSASSEKEIPMILLKSICDYADGNKDTDKDKNQKIALLSILDFCSLLFKSNFLYEIYKTNSYKANLKLVDSTIIENILFNLYEKSKEKFFIEREIDENLKIEILDNNLWIHGGTGLGKTTSLFRSLKINNISFKIINLANCTDKPINEVLDIIYSEIKNKLNIVETTSPQKIDVKEIDKLIKDKIKNETFYFIIEEIPIDEDENSSSFVNEMISWIILNYNNTAPYYLYFSSLFDPTQHIKQSQSKVYEILKIKEYRQWESEEFERLISLINQELKLAIDTEQKENLKTESKCNPRFAKAFYKNYLKKDSLNNMTFSETLNETKRDLRC